MLVSIILDDEFKSSDYHLINISFSSHIFRDYVYHVVVLLYDVRCLISLAGKMDFSFYLSMHVQMTVHYIWQALFAIYYILHNPIFINMLYQHVKCL